MKPHRNKAKEEKEVRDYIKRLVPDRPHIAECIDLQIFGYHHDNCDCKCHNKNKSAIITVTSQSKYKKVKGKSAEKIILDEAKGNRSAI